MRDEGSCSAVQVMNVGEKDFFLRHGEFIGEAEQVTTVESEEAASRSPEGEKVLLRRRRFQPEDLSRNLI